MSGSASVGGIISGLDTDSIVSQLTLLRRAPQVRLQGRKTTLQKKLEAWDSLQGHLSSLKNATAALKQATTFGRTTGVSSNTEVATVATSPDAAPGLYTVTVLQTAQAHQTLSQGYADTASPSLGTGFVTFRVGSAPETTITVDASNNSLAGLRDAINRAGAGVTASIINDGSAGCPYRLVLTANNSGASNAITVSCDLSGGTAPTFATLQEGRDALVRLGEGAGALTVSKATNTITDLIPGVTLHLAAADPAKPVRLTVTRDSSSIQNAVEEWVASFNAVVEFIAAQGRFDTTTNTGGPLLGDPSLLLIQDDLLSVVGNPVPGAPAAMSILSQVGITMQGDGRLELDGAELLRALQSDPSGVAKLFAAVGEPSQSSVRYVSSTKETRSSGPAGYAVSISQVATRSRVTAGVAQTEVLALGETLTINGHDVTLTAGMTQEQVIAAINAVSSRTGVIARATGADGTGSGHYLTLECAQYGSAYSVSVVSNRSNGGTTPSTGCSGIGTLLVSDSQPAGEAGSGTGQTGVNVAGTINGEAATGSGQMLTGAASNPNTAGLVLQITATTPGDQGVVVFSRGVASQLDQLIERFTSGTESAVERARAAVQDEIEDVTEDMKRAEERLAVLQERLRAQFNRMESLLSQLQSQSASLSQQIASLSTLGKAQK